MITDDFRTHRAEVRRPWQGRDRGLCGMQEFRATVLAAEIPVFAVALTRNCSAGIDDHPANRIDRLICGEFIFQHVQFRNHRMPNIVRGNYSVRGPD